MYTKRFTMNIVSEFVKEVASWKRGEPTEARCLFRTAYPEGTDWPFWKIRWPMPCKKGRTCCNGRKTYASEKGYYFEPTILTNVTQDMLVMKEESFGPIIGIMKVTDDAEAIRFMQDTEYGLTAAVYSSDKEPG